MHINISFVPFCDKITSKVNTMKKGLLLLLPLLVSSLASCTRSDADNGKVKLSYGSHYDQTATALTKQEVQNKVNNEESFLKSIYLSCSM